MWTKTKTQSDSDIDDFDIPPPPKRKQKKVKPTATISKPPAPADKTTNEDNQVVLAESTNYINNKYTISMTQNVSQMLNKTPLVCLSVRICQIAQ